MALQLHWRELGSKLLHRCTIFDLYRSQRAAEGGREGTFYLLKAKDWINVVPLVIDSRGRECFLMVRQYRQGAQRLTVEFPAGLVERGESPTRAAQRELLEETGYRARHLVRIGTIFPNPAFMDNRCYTYYAQGLEERRSQALDSQELLEVRRVSVEELCERIGSGPYINSMTALALYWYLRHRSAGKGSGGKG